MTKLSDLGPPIPGKLHGGRQIDEHLHFYNCPACGQPVDQRDLRQVFWHERPGHEPLEPEPEAKILRFPKRRPSNRKAGSS
ncbi:hypothetical protein FJW08_23605 [Mesorhizobium sp. B3-2-1]|nr:hypothetical protein FJW08_23605 [Mesorhizobium sp. B3-2-1]